MEISGIQKILVISLSNLGDVILTTPVLTALRENFLSAFISVVVGPKGETLLKNSRTINEILIYDKKDLTFSEKVKFVFNLREKHFDLVIDLRNTMIPYLIGARYRGNPFFGKQETKMRQRHLNRLSFLKVPEAKNHFDFFNSEDEKSCEAKLAAIGISKQNPAVAIAPGAGSCLKRWHLSRYTEVAAHFQSKGFQVVIVGSEDENGLGDQVLRKILKKNVFNACGVFSIRELAAFLNSISLLISNDSSIMHLANELDRPVVAIFGPTHHQKYAKFGPRNQIVRRALNCSPCELAECRFERQFCMDEIESDEVIRVCEELLNGTRN